MKNLSQADHLHVEGDWRMIWNLHVPHKVKILLWSAFLDVFPTRVNLQARGVDCPALYLFCNNVLENPSHCFIDYSAVRECWVQ